MADDREARLQVEEAVRRASEEHVAQLSSQQQLLYASNRHAVLLIFQAMDVAGKDGAIRHVMPGSTPRLPGIQLQASQRRRIATRFSLAHHARSARTRAKRIFNRSYYEEVLIARVHPEILRSEGIPDAPQDDKAVWHDHIARSQIWSDTSMKTEPSS